MIDKPQHVLLLCRVTYFHSFDTYILKSVWEISKSQAREVHRHRWHTTTLEFLPQICDVIFADYDVSPSCRISHAMAQVCFPTKAIMWMVRFFTWGQYINGVCTRLYPKSWGWGRPTCPGKVTPVYPTKLREGDVGEGGGGITIIPLFSIIDHPVREAYREVCQSPWTENWQMS